MLDRYIRSVEGFLGRRLKDFEIPIATENSRSGVSAFACSEILEKMEKLENLEEKSDGNL